MRTDTIAAIATALSEAGIGIIRVSGPEAVSLVDHIFYNSAGLRKLSGKSSHTVSHGYIVDTKEGRLEKRNCGRGAGSIDESPAQLYRRGYGGDQLSWRRTAFTESIAVGTQKRRQIGGAGRVYQEGIS